MRRRLILFVLLSFTFGWTVAQDATAPTTQSANCTQVLRLARAVYEQGRLHELQPLLEDCIAKPTGLVGNFTVQEKIDALRLLCLAYIYLEEPQKADEKMLQLLQTDHFFELNPTDPAEFQALYRTFRTEPIFNWGAKIGANFNMIHLLKVYSVASGSAGNGTYKPGITFSGAAFIEREFFPKAKEGSFLRNTLVRADIFYLIRGNKIVYDELFPNQTSISKGEVPGATSEGKISTSWINFNVIARYRYNRESLWDPYFGIGASTSFLLGAKMNLPKIERRRYDPAPPGTTSAGNSYSGPSVDVSSAFNSFPIYASAVWGINRKFGELYFNFETRYQYGFSNLINNENRTIFDQTDYAIIFNDFRQSNIVVTVGVTIPQFSPKKLTK